MLTDLTHDYEELNQNVAPMWNLDISLRLKGKVAKEVDFQLKRGYKNYSGDLFISVRQAIDTISSQEDEVFKMVDKAFNDKIMKAALDYKRLSIIKYLEALSFFNEYARRLLQAIVLEEFGSDARRIMTPIDNLNTEMVTDPLAIKTFIAVMNSLTMDTSDFLKALKGLEGMVFNEDDYDAMKATNGRKIDPLNMGLMPTQLNLFYHLGLKHNEYRVAKHERNKEELAKLQLTVLALKERMNGTLESTELKRIEKQIAYHSDRANKLAAKIEVMEEGE